jgi:hypothetical protein
MTLLALLTFSIACGQPSTPVRASQMRVDALVRQINALEIGRVEIVHVPSSVMTNIRLTPFALERSYDTKMTIRDLRVSSYRRELTHALDGLSVNPEEEIPEVRWGIIFHDVNGTRISALYLNRNGTAGAVDDVPVAFSGKLFQWLQARLSIAME